MSPVTELAEKMQRIIFTVLLVAFIGSSIADFSMKMRKTPEKIVKDILKPIKNYPYFSGNFSTLDSKIDDITISVHSITVYGTDRLVLNGTRNLRNASGLQQFIANVALTPIKITALANYTKMPTGKPITYGQFKVTIIATEDIPYSMLVTYAPYWKITRVGYFTQKTRKGRDFFKALSDCSADSGLNPDECLRTGFAIDGGDFNSLYDNLEKRYESIFVNTP